MQPVLYSKKRNPAAGGQTPMTTAAVPHAYAANQRSAGEYKEIGDADVTGIYTELHKPAPSSTATAVGNGQQLTAPMLPIYTKLHKPPKPAAGAAATPQVTSSNDDDANDLTIIDNDLYEREGQSQNQGQQNAGSNDYECTLVENDLYRS